jgi:hypothetical protein
MPADPTQLHVKTAAKAARMRDTYRVKLHRPELTDKEIDELRQPVMRLARTLCEHVGKRFY